MKTKIIIISLCFYLSAQSQVSKTVNVTTPGSLSSLLSTTERNTVTNLTITGSIDARDFLTMRDYMVVLSDINISNVNIVAYTGTAGTYTTGTYNYIANVIPMSAFYNKSTLIGKTTLKTIILPNSVSTIQNESFRGCTNLVSVTLPEALTTIKVLAFGSCSSITTITIPNSVSTIESMAFMSCSGLSSITLSNTLTSIDNNVFDSCKKLSLISIPNSVTTIKGSAFRSCTSLATVNIPKSVTSIGSNAFQSCTGLISITIPNSVTSIGNYAFDNCNQLVSISFNTPSLITTLGDYAFSNCTSLLSVNIPYGVTTIGQSTFSNCSSLSSVIIPRTVNSIGNGCFFCIALSSVYAYPTIPVDIMSLYVFGGVDKTTCTLYVPFESLSYYQSAYDWKDFKTIIGVLISKNPTMIDEKIRIFPNPISDSFKIDGVDGNATLELTDMSGKLLLEQKIQKSDFVSVGKLPKGVYFVKLITNEGVVEKKVIKN